MSLRRQIASGLRALIRPAVADRDVADEVEHYLAEATAAYREQGVSDAEARRAAQLDLGSRTAVRQDIRAAGWETGVESLLVDLHRAVRRLRRSPAFAAVTAATLALGIGASTAMFSIVRPVLLQSLPYPDADRLLSIADADGPGGAPMDVTFGTFVEVMSRSRALQRGAVTRSWQPTLTATAMRNASTGRVSAGTIFASLALVPRSAATSLDSTIDLMRRRSRSSRTGCGAAGSAPTRT